MKITIDTGELTEKQAIEKIKAAYYTGLCKSFKVIRSKANHSYSSKAYYAFFDIEPPEYTTKTVCLGTRYSETCDCQGNRKKCTHYPENRR